jgi:predicted small secreted protein
MRRYFVSLLLWAGLLTACNSPGGAGQPVSNVAITPATPTVAEATNTPEPTAVPTETATPAPPPTISLDTTEIKRQVEQVKSEAAAMRGLKPRAAVPEHFISQDEMQYYMTQETLREYSVEEAHLDTLQLWLLMFIDDPELDLRQLEIEFAGESILGFYDHEKKELYVRTDQPTLSPGGRMTMAHEFVHSLQDQYYDLQKLLPMDLDHDQSMALRALVEGDATVSGYLYASEYMSAGDFDKVFKEGDDVAPPVPGRAPVYLQEGWQFPYVYGSNFILTIAEPGVYKPINKAFTDPPRTSEQIMHPEKYLESPRDVALPVELPPLTDTLGAGWTYKLSDTLGEFDLQVMLRENFIEQPEASEGWGGARYDLYVNGKDALAIMGSRWDTKLDASEFESALEQSFKLFGKYDTLWHDTRRVWGMKRSGDQIIFVSGTNLAAVQRVIAAIKP